MEPHKAFRFILALMLAPAILTLGLRVRFKGARLGLGVAYGSVVAAYAFSAVEDLWLADLFNILQHVSYAVAGIGLLASSVATRRQGLAGAGEQA